MGKDTINLPWYFEVCDSWPSAVTPYIELFLSDDSQCEQIKQPECLSIFPSNLTQFPNDELDFETQEEAGLQFHSFTPLLQTRCSPYLLPFLCGALYPLCVNGATVPICPYLCAMARHGCAQNMVRFGLDWKKSVQCLDLDFEEHDECLGVNGIEDVGKKLSSASASHCFRGEMVTLEPVTISSG